MNDIGKHNIITPFKGRTVDISKNVEVYRCLNRGGRIFSVRQGGKVIGHTSQLTLIDSKFVIHKGGQEKCKVSNSRNVHAFIRGKINNKDIVDYTILEKVTYDPYEDDTFIYHTASQFYEIHNSDVVVINKFGVFSDLVD